MKKGAILIIGWVIVCVLISSAIVSKPNAFFINGTILCGWLLFMIQLTWNQSETFYMHIKRYWFLIKNPDCIWNMMVEYKIDIDENTFNKIDAVFNEHFSETKIIVLSNIRRIYKLDTFGIEVSIDESEKVLNLHIDNLEISYRRSRNVIDQELGELFEKLSQTMQVKKTEYYFNIGFREFNPYYGFFIRRLNAKDINAFNVKFNVDNDKVTISKKSMEIHTTSLQKLSIITKEYLSLSPR